MKIQTPLAVAVLDDEAQMCKALQRLWYLTKPAEESTLLSAIKSAIAAHGALDRNGEFK